MYRLPICRRKRTLSLLLPSAETDASRQVDIVKETRTAAEAAYRSLVDTVNALPSRPRERMNERPKTISKARVTRAKKEDKVTM